MGIGNAYYEKIVYDENGQLLTASFMDYLMPQATDMPEKMELGHLATTTPLNPLGIKALAKQVPSQHHPSSPKRSKTLYRITT